MATLHPAHRIAAIFVLVLLAAGCDRVVSRPQVKGKVTHNGRAVGDQTLALFWEGKQEQFFTHRLFLKADGTFVGEVPMAGKFKVAIEPSLAAQEGKQVGAAGEVAIPKKYRQRETTDLFWEIREGENQKEFELVD
jgi:hypothetical protein